MTRGAGTASRTKKKRSRKAATPQRGPKTARRNTPATPSIDKLREQLEVRTRERDEALEQQSATSEVLKVISRSASDLSAALNTVLATACRLCGADAGTIRFEEGDHYRLAATFNCPPEWREHLAGYTSKPDLTSVFGQTIVRGRTVHIPDVLLDPDFGRPEMQRLMNIRAALGVPLVRGGRVFGAVNLFRSTPRSFTPKQIALVETFTDQAVIAIENARLFEAEQQRTRELSESLEQQTATSEVLQVISSSPGKLDPVFNAMLENATRICEAKLGNMFLRQGNHYRAVAVHGDSHSADWYRRDPVIDITDSSHRGTPLQRLLESKRVIHTDDLCLEETYLGGNPRMKALVESAGARTHLVVPMLRDDELIGAIVIYRQEVRPFTEKQIELVQNFAAQAVIAIENTRLLNELRESLQQQTATTEVLKVISSSPGDLTLVFDAMMSNAVRICEAKFGQMFLCEGDVIRSIAELDVPVPLAEFDKERGLFKPAAGGPVDLALRTKKPVHVSDMPSSNVVTPAATLGGARSYLAVPMLKEGQPIGVIAIYHQEVRPFTEKQIGLLQSFAAQAVIAIENTRLLNELRQRTDDLSEALEQQTATAEVLRVISSSPGELEPVFNAMLENAARICEAKFGVMYRYDNDTFHPAAMLNAPSPYADFVWTRGRFLPESGNALDRLFQTKQVIHTADKTDEQVLTPSAILGGARSQVIVPMLKDGTLIGAIAIYRQEVRPFSDKQIALLQNFAAQAVIAIENTRLLNELQARTRDLSESLEQQMATSEVLQVISSSQGDLEPVFKSILANATQICEAGFANLWLHDGRDFRAAAIHGAPSAYRERLKNEIRVRPGAGTPLAGVIETKRAVQMGDLAASEAYLRGDPVVVASVEIAGTRTLVCVPMLKEGELIGAISIYRQEIRPFTEKQIALVTSFADQAVIAIENTRLLSELRQRTDDLSKSLETLRTTQDRLVQTEKLASLGQLTAGIAHEIKNPLNFVNNFSGVSVELIDELQETVGRIKADDRTVAEIGELADTLRSNLDKIVQHGRRADAIVKNMLLHSRQGSAEHRPVDINTLVEESLNLAYHGARAEQQGFNITLERSLDPAAGEADVFPQDITRVLLNLISNGFYAATRRKAEGNGGDGYEPTLAAATRNLGNNVEITIRDNGTGIPPEVKDKMFNPFFTTKPAGEGTGLGLSISHDIVVKQHGGSIEVDTQPGEFTEFRIILPREPATIGEGGKVA